MPESSRLLGLRYLVRRLWRTPVFSAVVVATLAVALGALATVYAVVQAVLLEALPFAEPARLVRIENRPLRNPDVTIEVSYADYVAWERETAEVAALAGYVSTAEGLLVGGPGTTLERVPAGIVSWNLFAVLGARPLLGRPLQAVDDTGGAAPVVVISERLWRRRLGGDPDVVGSTLHVEGTPRTVVGVFPAELEYPVGAELWVPVGSVLPPALLENANVAFFNLVGRLAPGVSAAHAEQALRALQDRISNVRRPAQERQQVSLRPLAETLLADVRRPLLLLLGGAAILVLLACANVANLQVVRAIDRREELTVRAALGAGGWRLVAHPLGESLVLGVVAALAAVGVAWIAIARLVPLQPESFFRADAVRLGAPVLAAIAVAALVAVAVFAVAPLLWTLRERSRLQLGSRRHGSGPVATRLLDASAMLQIGLTTVLLLGAGVLVRSFAHLRSLDPGFATERVLTLALPLFGERYAEIEGIRRTYEEVVERVAALPGVEAAAGVLIRPLQSPEGHDARYTLDGRTPEESAALPLLNLESVTPGFFAAMEIPLEEGRLLTAADREDSAKVVVVSRLVADRLWPGESPLGKVLRWGGSLNDGSPVTVVGVTGNGRYRGLAAESLNIYVPHRQYPWPLNHLVVRTAGDPEALLPQLRAALREVDPGLQPVDVATTAELRDRALARPRFLALLLGVLALLATVVAALGLHGVLAYVVALRRRELGIRLALGGNRRHTVGLVLRRAARVTAWGVAAGLAAGWAAAWALRGLLATDVHGAGWTDPVVFAAVPLGVALLALAAASAPAAGAGRVDAAEVLRG